MSSNSFPSVTNPNAYVAQVYSYVIGHSELVIQASNDKEVLYLYFTSVKYFSGAMAWKGIDFQTASEEELLTLFHSTDTTTITDDTVKSLFHLYTIDDQGGGIKIIANKISIMNNAPSYFSQD